MIRDFSETGKNTLVKLIYRTGAGAEPAQDIPPGLYANPWSEQVGAISALDSLVNFESLLTEKSEHAAAAAQTVFETVQQSELFYDGKLSELVQLLSGRSTFIETLTQCMKGAAVIAPTAEGIRFGLGSIMKELMSLHSSLKMSGGSISEEDPGITLQTEEGGIDLYGTVSQADLKKIAGIVTGESLAFTEYIAKLETDHLQMYAGKVEAAWESSLKAGDHDAELKQAGTVQMQAGIDASLIDASWSAQSEHGSADARVQVGNVSAQIDASAGLFVYTEDGCIFSPHVSAQVGAGVSALEASAQGRFENDYIGVYGEAQADLLKAQAQAQLDAGLFNAEGKFDPQLHVKADAQANIADISASAGLSILGADVGVAAGLSFGVGAHAEIGYTDGRFKLDAGVSAGLGVSFALDIDLAGLMDGVKAAVSEAWSAISGEAVKEWEQFSYNWEHFWNGSE